MSKVVGLSLVLLAAPALALAAQLGSAPASVAPSEPVAVADAADLAAPKNVTYFSDPSFTIVVGRFGYDCCNNYVAWGSKTPFYTSGGCFPCFPPPK